MRSNAPILLDYDGRMAIKTVLIDDFDGTPLSGVSTTTFALNGAQYEIDLAPENAAKLKDALAPFVKAGRRVGAAVKPATPRAKRASDTHSNGARDLTAIREWAQANDYKVGDRGRIPAPVLEAYNAAH